MVGFEGIGRIIIIIGVIMVVLGLVLALGERVPYLSKLPGNILIKKDGISFCFPVVTFLFLSAILTLVSNFMWRFIAK